VFELVDEDGKTIDSSDKLVRITGSGDLEITNKELSDDGRVI
jgi:hypothetical protein